MQNVHSASAMQLYAVFNIISNAWAPLVQASTYTNLEHVDWCLLIYIQDFSWPNISQSLGRLQIQSVRLRIGWLRVLVGIWKSVRLVGLYLNWWLYAPQMCLTLHGKSVADAKRNLFDRAFWRGTACSNSRICNSEVGAAPHQCSPFFESHQGRAHGTCVSQWNFHCFRSKGKTWTPMAPETSITQNSLRQLWVPWRNPVFLEN